MPYTHEWTELTRDQATFFSGQIEAAKLAAFSPVAHDIGVGQRDAARFEAGTSPNAQQYRGISWPDPNAPNITCTMLGTAQSSGFKAFARTAMSAKTSATESIIINSADYSLPGMYGRGEVKREDMPELSTSRQFGLCFIASAIHAAGELSKRTQARLAAPGFNQLRTVGIETETAARMCRALSSFWGNLVIPGAVNEIDPHTGHAYNLARSLLDRAITRAAESDCLMPGVRGATHSAGVVFESRHDGLVALHQRETFPDTISLAAASQPDVDGGFLVEQYSIQARSVEVNVLPLPAQFYDRNVFGEAVWTALNATPKPGIDPSRSMSEQGIVLFEQRIARLLNEHVNRS